MCLYVLKDPSTSPCFYHMPHYTVADAQEATFSLIDHRVSGHDYCIPGRKSGILRIQYGHAAAEIFFWTR